LTSNNLLADRRLEFALMLKERGDLEGAASLCREALDLEPRWDAAHFALAEVLESLGQAQDACAHYTEYLRCADTDSMGAEIRLALLGATPVPPILPEPYVKALFDQYAGHFDESLVTKLEYRAPYLLRETVDRLRPPRPEGERILDLGCGTGLAGEAFRGRAAWLAGVDLSPGMIAEAARKSVYDDLREGEALCVLEGISTPFDLIVAADVLVYMGDLAPLMAAARSALTANGLFAFSLQSTAAAPYALGRECRYSHHPDYVRSSAGDAGMEVRILEHASCRNEAGIEVPGLICVLQRAVSLPAQTAADLPIPQDVTPLKH
jgi:predicted TPR repeat methyltransferase